MKKETRGRKKKDNPALARIEFRATDKEKELYLKAAIKDGKTLSEWFRGLGNDNT